MCKCILSQSVLLSIDSFYFLGGHIPSSSKDIEYWQDQKISTKKITGKRVRMFSQNLYRYDRQTDA